MTKNKIMVIDDSETLLFLLKKMLENDFIIETFLSAKEALNKIDSTYDAIILDLMMPEMSGLEFLEKIRTRKELKHTPILILTAKNDSDKEIAHLFELGANDYITKPFLSAELKARVKLQTKLKRLTKKLVHTNLKLKSKNSKLLHAIKKEELLNEKIIEKTVALKEASKKIHRLNKKLRYLARHDKLTTLLNRRSFFRYLERDIQREKRLTSGLSLLMVDIDFFKAINDTHGHLIGDLVLKQTSLLLKQNVREIDLIGRYGGEEFLIILPDTRLPEALILADRLLTAVQIEEFKTDDKIIKITISIGVTEYKGEESMIEFIERVDKALYDAKNGGRNCIKQR